MILQILWKGSLIFFNMLALMCVILGTIAGASWLLDNHPIICVSIFVLGIIIYYGLEATEEERKLASWDKESKS